MITLIIRCKPGKLFGEAAGSIYAGFPFPKAAGSLRGIFQPDGEERTVTIRLEQSTLTDEQRDWLVLSEVAMDYVESYLVKGSDKASETKSASIEVTIAQYGIENFNGHVLTREKALDLFNELREQETVMPQATGYHIHTVRIEGDERTGKIVARLLLEAQS